MVGLASPAAGDGATAARPGAAPGAAPAAPCAVPGAAPGAPATGCAPGASCAGSAAGTPWPAWSCVICTYSPSRSCTLRHHRMLLTTAAPSATEATIQGHDGCG